jgi:glutathione S-transferase
VRLGQPFETVVIDLSHRDPDFLGLTPTGKVPLLIEGDLKLYESQVIMDYLAERNEWKGAYAADPTVRNRQKLAMKQWDTVVLPAWYRGLQAPSSFGPRVQESVEAELEELAATIGRAKDDADTLMGFHFAPFWAHIDWLRERSPLSEMVEKRESLKGWLDKAVALPAIQQTLPDRESTVRRYESHRTNSSGS